MKKLIIGLTLLTSMSSFATSSEYITNYDLLINHTKENIDSIKFDTKLIVDYAKCSEGTATVVKSRMKQPANILAVKTMLECPEKSQPFTEMLNKLNEAGMNIGTQWAYIRFKYVRDSKEVSTKVDKIMQAMITGTRDNFLR